MNRALETIAGLPAPVKLGGAAVALGGVGALLAAYGHSKAIYVVLAGLVAIGLLLMAYQLLLGALARRRAAPMERSLASNAAAAPSAISEPARRARLDDLRKNFESGVEKFHAAGKNLYALPWYALVGEPGSGKTEAIRHCNVGFPPGLQDQLQGVGGTLNMNWWFTNHAVILDTAGRLMFEEVEPGTTGEWQEFLKLLRKNRPNCPINGMLLVIPAESLIRDSAEDLERKGGKIAQQLDSIQRTLGVRFPVFVLITKCDLINGFREFFDEIADPALQHQILGWSNPAPLDTTFNPELVEQHLRTVQERLVRRRAGLLIDPVHTEDPRARRADQVDALYAFPDAMMKIAPRLKRYLEMIFVAGEWSQKPLFLRGIYFTSSMREGSALDAELADALGVPVESLPEGRVWERDRAYFLRDLFMQKVFREKGLVTRAVSTTAQQRARRNTLVGAAAAGMLAVGLFTWLGVRSLDGTIVRPADFWSRASEAYLGNAQKPGEFDPGTSEQLLPIVSKTSRGEDAFRYRGGAGDDARPLEPVPVDGPLRTRAGLPLALKEQAALRIGVPWVFYPVAAATGDATGNLLESERQRAARVLFEGGVLRPIIDACRVNLQADAQAGRWSPDAAAALAQLVRLEVAGVPDNKDARPVDLDPLLRYALRGADMGPGEYAKVSADDLKALDGAYKALYSVSGGTWPAQSLRPSGAPALARGVEAFRAAWTPSGAGSGAAGAFAAVQRLAAALAEFDAAERQLQALAGNLPADAPGAAQQWGGRYAALKAAAERADKEIAALKGRNLKAAYTEELDKYRADLRKAFDALLSEFEPLVAPDGTPTALASKPGGEEARVDALVAARRLLASSRDALTRDSEEIAKARAALDALDALHVANPAEPAYARRARMYALADGRVRADRPAGELKPGDARAALKAVADAADADAKALADLARPGAPGTEAADRVARAQRLCAEIVALGARARRTAVVEAYLDARRPAEFADAVAAHAQAAGLTVDRPQVPMTGPGAKFDPRFSPAAAAALVGDAVAVRATLRTPASSADPAAVLNPQDLAGRSRATGDAASKYLQDYAAYWSTGLAGELAVIEPAGWTDLAGRLAQSQRPEQFTGPLDAVQKAAQAAAEALAGLDPAGLDKPAADALAALDRATAQARATLAAPPTLAQVERALTNWRSLGADVGAAGQTVLARVTSGGAGDYLVLPAQPQGADFVQVFWRDLTLKCLRTLARDSAKAAAASLAELKGRLRFPLARPGPAGEELAAADLAAVKAAMERVPAPAPSTASSRWTGDADADREIDLLRTGAAVTPADAEVVARARAMLAALPQGPGQDQQCRVTVLGKEPPKPGNDGINSYIPYVTLAPAGGQPGKIASLFGGANAELAVLTGPGDPLEIRFLETAEQRARVLATVPIPSRWAAMYLIERFNGRPVGGRKVWRCEVELQYQGGPKSLWLELDFVDKELPERPWYP